MLAWLLSLLLLTGPVRVDIMHASMQYSDPPAQQRADADAVFGRAQVRDVWWVTGTEANQAADSRIFAAGARAHGYRYIHRGGDVWIAIDPARITPGTLSWGWHTDIPGVAHVHPDRGVLRASFWNWRLGWITILASHYNLVDATNAPIAADLAGKARWFGHGYRKVFYGGDQNMHLRYVDSFFGGPFTTAWDQLHHFEPTHYYRETIDTVASYTPDTRSRAVYCHARGDAVFPLHTDHYLVVAGYDVTPPPWRGTRSGVGRRGT